MESLKYLVSLVNDVLDMNKLQSGDLKDQQLLFDLTMVLRELNQIYDEQAAKKGIRYEIDWKNGTYSHSALVGNPVYLGRILSNIMDNVIKFSQAGSVLTVGVKEETLDDDRANFTFYCKDQGVGMSEDFIAHAFDMFAQESETKQLVDRMDGSIEIFEKSAPDYFGVIYMDIMMPRMNGLDAARTIREMKRRDAKRVPIIAMSANAFAEDIINSRLAGMNVHLAKPLDAEKMIIALKQCMADNSDVKLHEDL